MIWMVGAESLNRDARLTLSTARIFAQIKTSRGRSSRAELCSSFRTYGKMPTDRACKRGRDATIKMVGILRDLQRRDPYQAHSPRPQIQKSA